MIRAATLLFMKVVNLWRGRKYNPTIIIQHVSKCQRSSHTTFLLSVLSLPKRSQTILFIVNKEQANNRYIMSRRKGDFEHRTSIFEGAYRAWSHLGGLDSNKVLEKTADELDPLTYPLENDKRWLPTDSLDGQQNTSDVEDETPLVEGSETRSYSSLIDSVLTSHETLHSSASSPKQYFYEPLPRTGLTHPFVQAILTAWLGDNATKDAIDVGLSTLRTWWQHRKKGISASALKALETDKVRGIVHNYNRHFFKLAHYLVVNEDELPPRSIISQWTQVKRLRERVTKKKQKDDTKRLAVLDSLTRKVEETDVNPTEDSSRPVSVEAPESNKAALARSEDLQDYESHMTPLDKLHNAQKRLLSQLQSLPSDNMNKGKESQQKRMRVDDQQNHIRQDEPAEITIPYPLYCDNDKTPVVFVSDRGDVLIAMTVEGMTYPHCVNIVETVLRGCDRKEGRTAPILGIVDAAADLQLSSVLIKIDKSSQAKRIAFEAARNISMVGYTASVKEMDIVDLNGKPMDFSMLNTAFDVIANTESAHFFDWNVPCICMNDITARGNCARHKQLTKHVFEAFERREKQVAEFLAGCAKKYGLPCNCGPSCRCKGCKCKVKAGSSPIGPSKLDLQESAQSHASIDVAQHFTSSMRNLLPSNGDIQSYKLIPQQQRTVCQDAVNDQQLPLYQILLPVAPQLSPGACCDSFKHQPRPSAATNEVPDCVIKQENLNSIRNLSVISCISGLSTIEWDNMADFDVNEDNSAHIDPHIQDDLARRLSIQSLPESSKVLKGILRRTSVIGGATELHPATCHEKINPNAEIRVLDDNTTAMKAPEVSNNDDNFRRNAARTLSLISTMSNSLSGIEWDNIPDFDVNEDNSAQADPHTQNDISRRLSSVHSVSLK